MGKKNRIIIRIMDILGLLMIIATFVLLIIRWDAMGIMVEANDDVSDGRGTVIILVVLSFIMYGMISVIEHFPAMWNTGIKVTEQNKVMVYSILRQLISSVKFEMVVMFSILSIFIMYNIEAGLVLILVFLVSVTVTIVYNLIRLFKCK